MIDGNPTRRAQRPEKPWERNSAESGFVLLAVLFLVALIFIGLAVAAPKVAQDIQRDRELELYHRGRQYERAIRLYYKKTGGYPTDLSQIENTNNIRFLRKRYVDPITGQPFRIIHQGEAKAPILGLFGQPLSIQPAGTTPGNPIGSPIAGSPTGITTGTNGFGTSASGSSPFSSGSNSQSATTSSDGTGGTGTSTAAGTSAGATGASTGTGFGSTGSTGTGSTGSTGTGIGTGFGSTDSTGSTTVIGRIVGVSSTSPKASIRVYKKQTHYNQWEFVYDPAADALAGVGAPGQANLNVPGTTANPAQGTNPAPGPAGFQTTSPSTQPSTPPPSQ